MKFYIVIVAFALFSAVFSSVRACRCLPISIQKRFADQRVVGIFEVRVFATDAGPLAHNNDVSRRYASAIVVKTYKGCTPKTFGKKKLLFLQSTMDSCGVRFEKGSVLTLSVTSKAFLPGVMLCDLIYLSQADKAFLEKQKVCCKGVCR